MRRSSSSASNGRPFLSTPTAIHSIETCAPSRKATAFKCPSLVQQVSGFCAWETKTYTSWRDGSVTKYLRRADRRVWRPPYQLQPHHPDASSQCLERRQKQSLSRPDQLAVPVHQPLPRMSAVIPGCTFHGSKRPPFYLPGPANSSPIHALNASRFCGRPRNPRTSSVPAFDPPGSSTDLR